MDQRGLLLLHLIVNKPVQKENPSIRGNLRARGMPTADEEGELPEELAGRNRRDDLPVTAWGLLRDLHRPFLNQIDNSREIGLFINDLIFFVLFFFEVLDKVPELFDR